MIRAAILSLLLAFPVAAHEHLPQGGGVTTWIPFTTPCGPINGLFSILASRGEYLLFTGTGSVFGTDGVPYGGPFLIFAKPGVPMEESTWTIVQQFSDDFGCMIASGTNFNPYSGDQPQEMKHEDGV